MASSLLNVTVTKPQDLQVRLDDDAGLPVAVATARGNSWIVEVGPPEATVAVFSIDTYLSSAKMTEVLQALVAGYRELGRL